MTAGAGGRRFEHRLDHLGRLDAARRAVEAAAVDALVVTDLAHVRYLTGFTGSSAMLLLPAASTSPSAGSPLLVTDGRYRTQAAAELAAADVDGRVDLAIVQSRAEEADLVGRAATGHRRIGLEAASVTWSRQRELDAGWFPSAELVPTEGVLEALREVKEPGEVERIEAAAAIADEALAAVLPRVHEGTTEAELALELDTAMRRLGATDRAFETIVASGPNAALPHARPGARRIGEGDLVVLDFGAVVDGYHSDMTRTICVGTPTSTQLRLHEVVGAAHDAAREVTRAGVPAHAVDAAARAIIGEAGWEEAFPHGTGHGVGLEIHEAPAVGRTSTAILAAGSVITIEPGVYLPGVGGVRIEDSVLVTPDGCRALTRSPKILAV